MRLSFVQSTKLAQLGPRNSRSDAPTGGYTQSQGRVSRLSRVWLICAADAAVHACMIRRNHEAPAWDAASRMSFPSSSDLSVRVVIRVARLLELELTRGGDAIGAWLGE